jgi:hypothetical protein
VTARVVTWAGVVAAIAWIALLVVLIHRQPPAGAGSPQELATSLTAAYRDRDEGALARLVEQPADGAARLLDACDGTVRQVRVSGADRVELVGADDHPCGALPIQRRGDRWYVDPWTPLR